MSIKDTVKASLLQSFPGEDLLEETYTLIAQLEYPSYLIRITNTTESDLFISFDGRHDHEFIAYADVLKLYAPAAHGTVVPFFPEGMKIYAKGCACDSGTIYISSYYNPLGK